MSANQKPDYIVSANQKPVYIVMSGQYECRSEAGGQEVVVTTKLDIIGHKPLSACIPKSLQGSAPTITGWFSTVMIQSGETAR